LELFYNKDEIFQMAHCETLSFEQSLKCKSSHISKSSENLPISTLGVFNGGVISYIKELVQVIEKFKV